MAPEFIEAEPEQAILNVLHGYAWSYDSNDMEQLASVFSKDGMTVGVIAGSDSGWGPWQGAREIASQLGAIRSSQTDRRRHQIATPIFLKLTDSEAVVKAYLSIFSTEAGGRPRLVTTGQYLATLSKSVDRWTIDQLEVQLDGAF